MRATTISLALVMLSLAAAAETDPPRLDEVGGSILRTHAAVLDVSAGEFQVARLVYTPDIWGTEVPWDGEGSASVRVGALYSGSDAVTMEASGFDRGEEPIEPRIVFQHLDGEAWSWRSMSTSCSGCDGPNQPEAAWLTGSAAHPTSLRIGILAEGEDPDVLADRPGVTIRGDAVATDAWAGAAVRSLFLLEEYTYSAGPLEAQWHAADPLAGTARTSTYRLQEPTMAGTFAFELVSSDTAGAEAWGYHVDAAPTAWDWEGIWLHEPAGAAGAASWVDAAWTPRVTGATPVDEGMVSFAVDRAFHGAENPVGLVRPTYEMVTLGYVALDLAGLYDWDTHQVPDPSADAPNPIEEAGAAAMEYTCTVTSEHPDLPAACLAGPA